MPRPLWREGTKKAIGRVREEQAVQRAMLSEVSDELIAAELDRRGYADLARFLRGRATGKLEVDDEEGVIAAFLGKRWPPLADADLPFDGDERDE